MGIMSRFTIDERAEASVVLEDAEASKVRCECGALTGKAHATPCLAPGTRLPKGAGHHTRTAAQRLRSDGRRALGAVATGMERTERVAAARAALAAELEESD